MSDTIPSFEALTAPLAEHAQGVIAREISVPDLGIDSLGLVEWLFAIEEEHDIVATEEILELVSTRPLGEVYDLLVAHNTPGRLDTGGIS